MFQRFFIELNQSDFDQYGVVGNYFSVIFTNNCQRVDFKEKILPDKT